MFYLQKWLRALKFKLLLLSLFAEKSHIHISKDQAEV